MKRKNVTVKFDTGNAAFSDGNGPAEVGRILQDIAARIEAGHVNGTIRDVNGNVVGRWTAPAFRD